jgi:hypothetical protein
MSGNLRNSNIAFRKLNIELVEPPKLSYCRFINGLLPASVCVAEEFVRFRFLLNRTAAKGIIDRRWHDGKIRARMWSNV